MANEKITWELYARDAQVIMSILGDVPSKTGIWPLLANLDEQTKQQLTQQPANEPGGGPG